MLKKKIGILLRYISERFEDAANFFDPPIKEEVAEPTLKEIAHAQWLKDEGDKWLRYDYELSIEDVVVDLGGYEGQWTSDIYARYQCEIYIFEPVPSYFRNICKRFSQNPKIHAYEFGLAHFSGVSEIAMEDDASSAYKSGLDTVSVKFVNFKSWMIESNIENISLLKMNIEGGEYELLEYLIKVGLIEKIKFLQIQFHDFVPDSDEKLKVLQESLLKTHVPIYQYHYVWESWSRKLI